jgi:protein TonB
VLSLTLHIGAALVIIIASGFSTGVKNTNDFITQDFALTPSTSAPAKSALAPPDPHPAMTSTTRTEAQDTDKPMQEPVPEQPSNPSGSSEKEGGLMSTPLGLGMTHGYFSGLADGRSLRDDIRGYYFEMVAKINREWWEKAGLLKEPLRQDGIFELVVQRDGTIVSIRMLQRTGSSEADRLLTEIIRKASPLSPLPSTYELDLFKAPLRIKAPSFLFRLSN